MFTTSATRLRNAAEPSGRSAGPDTPAVQVGTLVKTFRRENGTRITPVDHVDLSVERGEMVVLLGPSGCGKTTLLRCIAGLETPDSGTISVDGQAVYDSGERLLTPTEARNISMVFQSYALWPHMTVLANIAYPLKVRKVPKQQIRERARKVLEVVGIPELENQYPGQLSGGQQQRVALARAIVPNTNVILFDEPLSNVDAKVRETLRLEMATMQRELGFSAIYVTHDQEEAMELADRIVVLKDGVIEQAGPPSEVYGRPRTRYVADFIGTINEVAGTVSSVEADGLRVQLPCGDFRIAFDDAPQDVEWAVGDQVSVTWRPESTQLSDQPLGTTDNTFTGSVVASVLSGAFTKDLIDVGGMRVRAWRFGRRLHRTGDQLNVHVPPDLARAYPVDARRGSTPSDQVG